jgi:4-amino-4-deoxy-L-arabinose transferase-like glycosyltransferase
LLAPISDFLAADGVLPGLAFVFRQFHVNEPVSQLYAMRLFSTVCGLLTICAAWGASRLVFGATAAGAIAMVLALHPQFLLVSIAANPDALVNVFGALTWYFAARLLAGELASAVRSGWLVRHWRRRS